MFIGSGLELNFVSEKSFIAEINVGEKIIDGVADMGISVDIRNSGS